MAGLSSWWVLVSPDLNRTLVWSLFHAEPEALQSELSGSCSYPVKEWRTSRTSPNATSAGVILSPVLETQD